MGSGHFSESLATLNPRVAEMSQCSWLGRTCVFKVYLRLFFSSQEWASRALCMYVWVCQAPVHSKTCLTPRRSKGPTCPSGYLYWHKIQGTSAPGIETHWLHLWIRLDPNKETDFVLGKHGVGGKGREMDTDQSGTVIYILRFLELRWLWSPLLCF